jgi:hypothetical protein
MNASARKSVANETNRARHRKFNGRTQTTKRRVAGRPDEDTGVQGAKPSVFVAADNRLLREALARMLAKGGEVEVRGLDSTAPFRAEHVARAKADVLLLMSRGTLDGDLLVIQQVRMAAPGVRVLLLGMAKNEGEFLQCIRGGYQRVFVA